MEEKTNALHNETATAAVDEKETKPDESVSPVKQEIERERKVNTSETSEKDKAAYRLRQNADRLRKVGGDPLEALGLSAKEGEDEDDRPLTRSQVESIINQRETMKSRQTALDLAEDIADADERELTKIYLEKRLIPSGDPHKDLATARALVNSVKNSQIIEQSRQVPISRSHPSSSGMPAKAGEDTFVPTPEEEKVMKLFPKMTKEKILAARKSETKEAEF